MNLTILRKGSIALILLAGVSVFSIARAPENPSVPLLYDENCTSIMVGRLASSDGSVMTSHSCDGNYRTWLEIVPHKTHDKGAMHPVYWGTLNTEDARDINKVTPRGSIPEVAETYAFLNTAYPCLNEKQLAIGESTIYGRQELKNEDGLFLIEELEKIALQRCTTARQAIRLIGELAEEYGYADLAEGITIADPEEVWLMEIAGSGPGKPSAIWAARRVPDDHVSILANIPRISDVDFDNPDIFMYCSDLKKRAKKLGYWDGEEPLKFWKVISDRKPFAIREFYILSTLAPSLNLSFDADELPFSVKPEKKITVQDMFRFFRETYEDTPWDMTKNLTVTLKKKDDAGNEVTEVVKSPVAHNWMSNDMRNLLNELNPGTVERQRTIAIAGCSYSHVIQCRSWLPDEVGAVAWFAFDNPGQSPRIPIFSGTRSLPESFQVCGQNRYRTDAAIWSFREANRLATVNWSKGRTLIEPAVLELEKKALAELPVIEQQVVELAGNGKNEEAVQLVTSYTRSFAYAAMKRWEEIKSTLWSMFGRGF